MKNILLLSIALLSTVLCWAQKDPEAEKLLIAVEKKANAYHSIKTDFEYQINSVGESGIDTYKGSVLIKGKKFKMELDGTTTFSDGKTRWVFLKGNNEVNISDIVSDEDLDFEEKFLIDPLSIFSIYKNGFKYMLNGNETIENKNLTVIDLSPESLDNPYFKIRCWFTSENDLHSLKYFLKDGTRMTLILSNIIIDQKVKDSDFEFNTSDYKGVEIIDLR
ncbi:MAG: outer membrane lipoprotein carrier protein LolA [Salinivirgaceae bacterium]|nr:outer membrane lipoprotein carrier protein LolA [Salinivirgaceae bacterium]